MLRRGYRLAVSSPDSSSGFGVGSLMSFFTVSLFARSAGLDGGRGGGGEAACTAALAVRRASTRPGETSLFGSGGTSSDTGEAAAGSERGSWQFREGD